MNRSIFSMVILFVFCGCCIVFFNPDVGNTESLGSYEVKRLVIGNIVQYNDAYIIDGRHVPFVQSGSDWDCLYTKDIPFCDQMHADLGL